MPPLLVDIHTHIYPPSYIDLLSSRKTTPYIHYPESAPSNPDPPPRLIILPTDDDPALPPSQRGRPINASYTSIDSKLAFMNTHSISTSIISLANPWLDFLPATTASSTASALNTDLDTICASHHPALYAFATLPLSAPIPDIVAEINRLPSLAQIKGVILGTTGLGTGLDDSALDPIWAALEETQLLIFVHPHYGLPSEVFGPRANESGHVLPLALGFPLETTIAFYRMYLVGVFERFPRLKVLLAHAGGAVPFLAGRVKSCIWHERRFVDEQGQMKGGRSLDEVLKSNVWLDGVVYSEVGVRAAVDTVGRGRVLWGTDHPFFPPIGGDGDGGGDENEGGEWWLSVKMNIDAVYDAFEGDVQEAEGILGRNAVTLLDLDIEDRPK